MKRWYQFSDGHSPRFGFGTAEQAQRYLVTLNAQRAVNHYVVTELDKGEEPPDGALVVNLDAADLLLGRHRRITPHGG